MTKNEFIAALESQLLRLSKADRDDILGDYDSHFAAGIEKGLTEDEVSVQLGDPGELAANYLENLPSGSKGAPYQAPVEEAPPAQDTAYEPVRDNSWPPPSGGETVSSANNSNGIVMVVLVSIALAIFTAGPWIGLVWGLLAGGIGVIIGGFSVIAAAVLVMLESVVVGIGVIFVGLGLIALGILMIVGFSALVKLTVRFVKWYIDWCKKTIG